MNDVVLYSTGCPKCLVLKKKLDQSSLQYEVCEDVERIRSLGFDEAPILGVDIKNSKYLSYKDAVKYVNSYIKK